MARRTVAGTEVPAALMKRSDWRAAISSTGSLNCRMRFG